MVKPFDSMEVRLALQVGQRLVENFSQRDPQLDTDLFRQVVGSTVEILLGAIQKVPPETRQAHTKIPWGELNRYSAQTLAEWVDMEDSAFWQALNSRVPLLVKTVATVVKDEAD